MLEGQHSVVPFVVSSLGELSREAYCFKEELVSKKPSTTRELSVKRIDLQGPTLEGPPWANQGAGSPNCNILRQLTIYHLVPAGINQYTPIEWFLL